MLQNRRVIYAVTSVTAQLLMGMISTYSTLKHSIGTEFNFGQSFLGAMEFISFIAEIISGLILVFFPSKHPKFTYFLYSCITVVTLLILISMHFLPSIASVSMTLGMIGLGFSRSVFMLPFIIISQYYHPESEAYYLNIWLGLLGLGEASGYFLSYVLITYAELHWTIVIAIWTSIFFLSAVILQVGVKEIQMIDENCNKSITQKIEEVAGFFREFLKKPKNKLLILDYGFEETILFNNILWVPYFFNQMGLSDKSTLIGLIYSLAHIPGVFFMEFVIMCLPNRSKLITVVFLFLNACIYFTLLYIEVVPENFVIFIVLFGMSGLCMSGPSNRTSGSDSAEVVHENNRHKYLLINAEAFTKNLLIAFFMVLVGFMMQNVSMKSFLYVQAIVSIAAWVIHASRRLEESYHYDCWESEDENMARNDNRISSLNPEFSVSQK